MTQAVLLALEQIDGSLSCLRQFCGLTLLERNLRLLRHCGIGRAIILTVGPEEGRPGQLGDVPESDGIQVGVVRLTPDVAELDEFAALAQVRDSLDEEFITLRADFVYDKRALGAVLSAGPDTALAGRRPPAPAQYLPDAEPNPVGSNDYLYGLNLLRRSFLDRVPSTADRAAASDSTDLARHYLDSGDLALLCLEDIPPYVVNLRRALPVACFAVRDETDRKLGWRILIDATQKGALDWPAQILHPTPENALVRVLLHTPVTPNFVTVVSNLCAFIAIGLFWQGSLAAAVALGLTVGVLDGVDGKLARIKLLYSRFGDRLDHVLDVIYEPLWYLALGAYLSAEGIHAGQLPLLLALGIVALYFIDRATTGLFKRRKKVELFDRAPVDRLIRRFGARRNTNVLILLAGLLAGGPMVALWAILALTATTTLAHMIRAIQMRDIRPANGA